MHVKKSWYMLVTVVMLVAMLAGCAPVAPAATAPAAGGEAAAGDMPYAGTELRLVGANHPWQVAITPLLAEFEAATGIKVNFEALGEDQLQEVGSAAGQGGVAGRRAGMGVGRQQGLLVELQPGCGCGHVGHSIGLRVGLRC